MNKTVSDPDIPPQGVQSSEAHTACE